MGDVVNLNKHRKSKERAAREKQAEANRLRFGRTRGERDIEEAEAERQKEVHELLKFEAPHAVPMKPTPDKTGA